MTKGIDKNSSGSIQNALKKITLLDRLRTMRETEFGAFLPVLFALAAIWGYFGFILPLHDLITGEAESFRAIFLSPEIYIIFYAVSSNSCSCCRYNSSPFIRRNRSSCSRNCRSLCRSLGVLYSQAYQVFWHA